MIGFALASFYRTFPTTWFAVILIAAAALFAGWGKRALIVHVVLAVIIVGAIHKTERSIVYSPYYALRVMRSSRGKGIDVLVNGSFHQYAAPLARTNVPTT